MNKERLKVLLSLILVSPSSSLAQTEDLPSVSNINFILNDHNAGALGINMNSVRENFKNSHAREILSYENLKASFSEEGNFLDLSTLDNSTIRLPLDIQMVGPNKGDWFDEK